MVKRDLNGPETLPYFRFKIYKQILRSQQTLHFTAYHANNEQYTLDA